jgi:arylsulfatase A-like enzyme
LKNSSHRSRFESQPNSFNGKPKTTVKLRRCHAGAFGLPLNDLCARQANSDRQHCMPFFCPAFFCLFLLLCGSFAAADERPNVLFISLDDMNDWLGCYGGHPDAQTPNIDRLAKRGVLFTNAHCVSPICGPSRAAVLTGMRPETTGVYHNRGTYIDYVPEAVTFPEHFRANGYRALAAGKVNHGLGEPDPRLWDENGPDCGVLGTPFIGDELHTVNMTPQRVINRGPLTITLPANGGLSAIDRPNNTWDSFDWAPLDCPESEFPDRKIADWGVEQLGKERDRPFLLALGFYKPHQPFFVPRKYFDLYDPKATSLPTTIAGDLYDVPPPGRELATRPWTSGTHKTVVAHGAWRDAVRAYHGFVCRCTRRSSHRRGG